MVVKKKVRLRTFFYVQIAGLLTMRGMNCQWLLRHAVNTSLCARMLRPCSIRSQQPLAIHIPDVMNSGTSQL